MDNLRKLREARGWTQFELAEQLGIPSSTYQQYEANIHEPPFRILFDLGDIFQVKMDYLMDRTDILEPPTKIDTELAYQLNHLKDSDAKKAILVLLKTISRATDTKP